MKYKSVKLGDVIEFNPKETLKKNDIAKKVPMDALKPFTRKIDYFEITEFKSGTKFKNNDTLMARITPCLENGKTSFVDILEENEVGFGSTEYFVLRAVEEKILPKYLYYLSISMPLRNAVIKSMTGTSGRQRAQKEALLNFQVSLPSILEQKKILKLLDSIDSKIELNNQIIDTLEEIASTLFKRWFVDFEFPDENGNPYKSSGGKMIDSELGEIPEGWKVDIFGAKMSFISKGTTPTKKDLSLHNTEEMVSFLKVKDMPMKGLIKYNILEKIPKIVHETKLKRSILKKGDVLLSIAGTIGRVNIVTENISLNTNQAVSFIRFFQNKNVYYYMVLLKSDIYQQKLKEKIVHAVQPNLSLSEIKSLKIISPPEVLIDSFLKIISPIYFQIIKLDKEANELEEIRDTLLPKLLSGEIEV